MRRCPTLSLAAGALLALCLAPAALAAKTVAWIEIKQSPPTRHEGLAALLGGESDPTLRDLVGALREAATDPGVDGVVVRLREPELTRGQVDELGAAIKAVRKAGKKTLLFTEVYGPEEVLLGSYTDEAVIQSGGAVSLPGVYMEEMFLADSLALLGLKADMVQIGDYKGAKEQMSNSAPSKAWDENISGLLDSLYAGMRARLKEGRHLDDAALDKAMSEAFLASADDAVRLKLVDKAMDRVDLEEYLEAQYGEDYEIDADYVHAPDEPANPFASGNIFGIFDAIMNPKERGASRDTIALVQIDGEIVDGESKPASLLGGVGVGSLTIREALRDIEDDDMVKGVVVRIDSPGGSAIASESIWLGLRRIAKDKPVWVSVGDMAASGGYYLLSAGDKVYVNPSSIVGSIGVVGGKIAMGGLYDKLRVHVVSRARGPGAAMMSTLAPWSDAERALVTAKMKETYDLFVDRVRKGRPGIDISKTAEGRLFVGKDAVDKKMADEVGGLEDCIEGLAAKLGLSEGAYDVMEYPAPKTIREMIGDMVGGLPFAGASAPGRAGANADALASGPLAVGVAALREAVGPRAWPGVRDAIGGLLQLREERVLLVAPRTLVIR